MTDNNNLPTTRLPGQLTIANVAEVKAALDGALASGGDVVVDAAELANVDTAGVQLLVALGRHAESGGLRVAVEGLQPGVVAFAEGLGLSAGDLAGPARQ